MARATGPADPSDEQHRAVAAERDRLVVTRLLEFFRPRSGRWKTPTGEAWQPALAVDAVVNTYERTGDPRCLNVIERSFRRYRGRRSHYVDDDGWYLNAWLRAYDVTGDARYLDEAAALFAGMADAWDDVCAGGVWWNRDKRYKNAITNELFLLAAARLHRRAPNGTGTGSYYDHAMRSWDWFDASGMINAAHLVNDGLTGACTNNGQTTWTYNQGVVLGALAEMRRITGDRAYLDRAAEIADAAIGTLVYPDGVLREPCEPGGCSGDAQVFKGVLVQGLARLCGADGAANPAYRAFLNANADAMWTSGRDATNGVGLVWRGPPGPVTAATQTAAALLTGGIALLHQGGETTAVR